MTSILVALLLCALPGAARAQFFLASQPAPPFAVGPLFVRASVTPHLGPVTINLLWGVAFPSGSRAALGEDLYLLWPGAVAGEPGDPTPDPKLVRDLESRGFTVIGGGRLRLHSVNVRQTGRDRRSQPVEGGAPFVTFVREGGALGVTAPATYIRIPGAPNLGNPDWLMDLRLTVPDLIQAKQATWIENLFTGRRQRLSISFNNVRTRALFPFYFQHRNRIVRLADEPSQLLINFSDADRLRIDEVSPPSSNRRPSESVKNTEVVSLFLDRSEGLTPQTLTVEFAYFSGIQAWAPILIPTLFFVLGNLAGFLIRTVADRVSKRLAGRVLFGPARDGRRQAGTILPRDTLARIEPGTTTYDQVLQLCGPDGEQVENIPSPEHHTLVYRGRQMVPQRRRTFGWLTTVSQWDVEQHEVAIEFEHDVVSDVKAHVRRSRQNRF